MKAPLKELSKRFNAHYKQLYDLQEQQLNNMKAYSFDLSEREITDAIIARMDAFWFFATKNKALLGRNANAPAADFFTETVLLFFKAYFEQRYGNQIQVCSEKNIAPKGNIPKIIKPDISILSKSGEPLAVVELKVNDAWKRTDIYRHLSDRKANIQTINQNCFFGVISFWKFKDQKDSNIDRNERKKDLNIVELKEFKSANKLNHVALDEKVETLIQQIDEIVENRFQIIPNNRT